MVLIDTPPAAPHGCNISMRRLPPSLGAGGALIPPQDAPGGQVEKSEPSADESQPDAAVVAAGSQGAGAAAAAKQGRGKKEGLFVGSTALARELMGSP